MKKTIIDPTAGDELVDGVDDVEQTAYSRGVVVEFEGQKRVYLSGITPVETVDEPVREQTRELLERIERMLEDHGGTINDIVRIRIFVEDVIGEDFAGVHAVRGEFFDPEHFPASTLVEVEELVRGNIEIEIEAIIPADGWVIETVEEPGG